MTDNNDNATIIRKFYSGYRGQFPMLAAIEKSLRGFIPTSSTIEREFSSISILLNRRRNRLSNITLLRILQSRNFHDLLEVSETDRLKTKR